MVQVFLNMVEFGMNPQEAVAAPRVGSESFPCSAWPHGRRPGRLNVEAGTPDRVISQLQARGHDVRVWDGAEIGAGHACAALRRPDTGVFYGAADPRSSATACVW